MQITPSSRILKMLGEIEFTEWQCIAELIDNSFDDFSEIISEGRVWPGGYKVSVSLPKRTGSHRVAEVVIRDTGQGMTRERLKHAVRAGWSSNNQFDKLGLFGMGFNVSTARLGRRTRVLTTRSGDTEWFGVDIDLDEVGDDFEVPDLVEEKTDPSEHGTKIVVSKLDPDRADWLSRNTSALSRQLGKVYGWLLENRPFELHINGTRVRPRKHCIWDAGRIVHFGRGATAENISAVISIDTVYTPQETCIVCGNWQQPNLGRCDECDSAELKLRDRRMHGWLGIQRHLDKTAFGIDFIRNGRKILIDDKRIFEWADLNDPSSVSAVEYPTELGQGGRIVGEIHLDHVPVTYQKNAFEYSDRQWIQAIHALKGPGPLLPQKARELGYPENSSPLGKLIKGFRRTDPGYRYLIPGDGRGPIHEKTKTWARSFHEGDPEYQSDRVWWEAVVLHEESKKNAATENQTDGSSDPDIDSMLAALDLGPHATSSNNANEDVPVDDHSQPEACEIKDESTFDRLERYEFSGIKDPALSGDLGHQSVGFLSVTTFILQGPLLTENGDTTPVLFAAGAGKSARLFIDSKHRIFNQSGWTYAQGVVTELASFLKYTRDSPLTIVELASRIQTACLPDTALSASVVGEQARDMLQELRQMMLPCIQEDTGRAWQFIEPDELAATENRMVSEGVRGVGVLGENPSFLLYSPPLFLVRLVEEWPEVFFDDAVFSSPFISVQTKSARRSSVSRISSLLSDVVAVSESGNPSVLQLQRAKLSIEILQGEVRGAH